jgi:hypothetical protein
MKKLFTIFILCATTVFAQSPTAFRSLNHASTLAYNPPNAWAGSVLSYPLVGKDFDLSFGVSGKFVIDFTELKIGRQWNILTYGDLGLPNPNNVNGFTAVASEQEGIDVGLQAYTTFGNLQSKSFTTYLNAKAKLNSFGDNSINSYHFGTGLELSLRGGGLPLIVNVSPAYVLLANKEKFARVQNETDGVGFWKVDAFVIIPAGDKLGVLAQWTSAENVKRIFSVGLILSSSL